ncbi:hypothetical protein H1Q63_05620 [Desmonostoc muscorum CCALA 125]|nr:hypothetical protein [Desmonostoc muscorum CCALA 125]
MHLHHQLCTVGSLTRLTESWAWGGVGGGSINSLSPPSPSSPSSPHTPSCPITVIFTFQVEEFALKFM